MKVNRKYIACLLALALFGCSSLTTPLEPGYEFLDATKSLIEIQRSYCTETNPHKRALSLLALRSVIPEYPTSGLCTNALKSLSEAFLEDAEKSELYLDYLRELEQAQKDVEMSR